MQPRPVCIHEGGGQGVTFEVVFHPPSVEVEISAPVLGVTANPPIARDLVERDPYTGAYTVTPSADAQTLQTNGLRMTDNITIEPIPSNYGLITWNGSTITVS